METKRKFNVTKTFTVPVYDLLPGSCSGSLLYPDEPSGYNTRTLSLFSGSPKAFEIWKTVHGGLLSAPGVEVSERIIKK